MNSGGGVFLCRGHARQIARTEIQYPSDACWPGPTWAGATRTWTCDVVERPRRVDEYVASREMAREARRGQP